MSQNPRTVLFNAGTAFWGREEVFCAGVEGVSFHAV
jgi:hypothetical protein